MLFAGNPREAYRQPRAAVPDLESRTARLRQLLDDVVYQLALLMAGHEPSMDALEPSVAQALRAAIAPLLEAGYRVDPDFGERAGANVVGLESDGLVRAELVIKDRSVLVDPGGTRLAPERRAWQLTVFVSSDLARVVSLLVRPTRDEVRG
ncbi:MAG: hypothetical protein ACYDGR_00635 [Candidatus Dormibacteria bacterium]